MESQRWESARRALIARAKRLGVYDVPPEVQERREHVIDVKADEASERGPRSERERSASGLHLLSDKKRKGGSRASPSASPRQAAVSGGAGEEEDDDLLQRKRKMRQLRAAGELVDDELEPLTVMRGADRSHISKYAALEAKLLRPLGPPRVIPDHLILYPRRLEDEGIYDAPKPFISDWNWRKYVARLERDDPKRQWFFDAEERPLLDADPVNARPLRPFTRGDLEAGSGALDVCIETPVKRSAKDDYLELLIEIRSVSFKDHPQFTKEDVLCMQLQELFAEYRRRQTVNLLRFYKDKVRAFRKEARALSRSMLELEDRFVSSGGARDPAGEAERDVAMRRLALRLIGVLEHLQEARLLRDEEEGELQQNFKRIYKLWTSIRMWREDRTARMKMEGYHLGQAAPVPLERKRSDEKSPPPSSSSAVGASAAQAADADSRGALYVGYPLRLRVRQTKSDVERDQAAWDRDLREELEERRQLFVLKSHYSEASASPARGEEEAPVTPERDHPSSSAKDGDAGTERHRRGISSLMGQVPRDKERGPYGRSGDTGAGRDGGEGDAEGDSELGDVRGFRGEAPSGPGATGRPAAFDDKATRSAVLRRMQRMRRPPGTPVYTPELDRSIKVTPDDLCTPEEQARRQEIQRRRVAITLLVNEKDVMTTAYSAVSFPFFTASFNSRTSVRVLSVPKSVKCRVEMEGFISAARLADVFVPVPEFGAAQSIQHAEFSGSRIEAGKAPTDRDVGERRVSGDLEFSMTWAPLVEGQRALPPEVLLPRVNATRSRSRSRVVSLARGVNLLRVADMRRDDVDPNDPRNAALVELLRRAQLAETRGRVFRVSVFQRELILIPSGLWVESARRQVLRVRHETGLVGEGVPLRDEEIPESMYELVEVRADDVLDWVGEGGESATRRKVAGSVAGFVSGATSHLPKSRSPLARLDTTRAKFQERAQDRLRAKQKMRNFKRDVTYASEVVREEPLPDFAFNLAFLDRLFRARRPLRVDRDKTKPVTNPQNCHIIAQIVRGHNVPVRRSRGDFGAGQTQAQAQAQELNTLSPGAGNVRVFVEVYFQGHVKRTMVSRGTNPHWDELLALPFIPPGGSFFPGALQQVRDRVYFNVFDEVTTVLEEDYRLKHTHVRKTEHRWLGQFSVPFTTIYMNGRVEGLFTVEVPIMHLGYEKPQPSRPTQLWVYLTLDPVLVTPPPDNDAEKWRHRSAFFEHCVQWEESVRALPHCRTRNLASLVNDINGQPRLVCRYVAPQAPPDGMTLNMYPRFVSMVPFEEDWQQTGGAQDVWCTADEFLTLGAGDWEEHALLLCNYFKHYESTTLAQGWHTYVAIGHGIPEGKTAYVLRIHEQDGIIDQELVWNPVTGECYNIRNEAEACPLVSIGCVFDERDVWANVQPSAEPARINFYFENLNYWRPLFNRQFSRGEFLRRTLQTPVNYFRVPEDHFVDRAQRIERAVERQFERWRRLQTRWNYGVSHILRDMLQEFEGLRQNGKLAAAEENRDLIKLRQIYDTMYGFPLSFADTGEDDMLEVAPHNPVVRAVFNTRIHENEDPAAEFALGVYIYPYYPNRVASIWVYIAVLSSSHPLA